MAKLKGIGLLELMLSLAIIAALILLSTMYFSTVSNNQNVTLATNMVHDIYGAAKNYAAQNNFEGSKNLMKTLIDEGFLTSYYRTDPWGGMNTVIINSSGAVPTVTISMASVPQHACKILVTRLLDTINQASNSVEEVIPGTPEACPKRGGSKNAGPRSNVVSVTYVLY